MNRSVFIDSVYVGNAVTVVITFVLKWIKLKTGILKVLAYFDLFDYPVSAEEIRFLLDCPVEKKELLQDLEKLVQSQFLFRFGEFYSLTDDPSSAKKRLDGNQRAKPLISIGSRIAAFLFWFPFVRGVAISGSLSKNFAEVNADIDLFIITKANRLWIARTLLHLFKKLTYLTGNQHWYCMNYFIDEEALLIEEKNIFTATELITLMPKFGAEAFVQFFQANDWANLFFPNYQVKWRESLNCPGRSGRIKKAMEFLFNNRLGDRLDNYFHRLTARRWSTKEEKHQLNMRGNRMALKTGKHFSKPNPVFFQEKLLTRYRKNLSKWEEKWAAEGIQDLFPFFLREII
jgi:hypothetical protein